MGQTKEITLNEGQQNAYDKISEFLNKGGDSMLCIKGYAGTGKTFLITKFFNDYLSANPFVNVALSAPTNKAVGVLKREAKKKLHQNVNIKFLTIHKILGVKSVITEDGREIFEPDNDPDISAINILVVDEVSMLDDFLFYKLKPFAKKTKIIFMGDPAQIPPVNKIDCEPFLKPEEHNIETIELTKIERQGNGSKIVEESFTIRQNLKTWSTSNLTPGKYSDMEIIGSTSLNDRLVVGKIMDETYSSQEFRKNPENYRLITWRNVLVNSYNNFIRKKFFKFEPTAEKPNLDPYLIGDLLITNDPVFGSKNKITINTSQEIKVIGVEEGVTIIANNKLGCYDCRVEFYDENQEKLRKINIQILKEEYRDEYQLILNDLANIARLKPDRSFAKKTAWTNFWGARRRFANVSYAFALTAHKSQGSGFDYVIVDLVDIGRNSSKVEGNRIAYTAITRAVKNCVVIIE